MEGGRKGTRGETEDEMERRGRWEQRKGMTEREHCIKSEL